MAGSPANCSLPRFLQMTISISRESLNRKSLSALLLLMALFTRPARGQLPEDQPQGPALSPLAAVSTFEALPPWEWSLVLAEPDVVQPVMVNFDLAGRMWVVQYLQYPNPAGIQMLSRELLASCL